MEPYLDRGDVGFIGLLIFNYGGQRHYQYQNAAIQNDLDQSTATIMCIQEANQEFVRDDSWICCKAPGTGLVICARKSRVQYLDCVRHVNHYDGTYRKKRRTVRAYTGVQFVRVTLARPLGSLGITEFYIINCHFHHCTAKRLKGGGLRASHEWFFDYLVDCYRQCASNCPCLIVGDFNMSAYEEIIPTALKNRNTPAILLGRQQCCICCYSVGAPIDIKVKRTCMNYNRWHICNGGMHEPLLLYLGSRPLRSEQALCRRMATRAWRNEKKRNRRCLFGPYPDMFFYSSCLNDCEKGWSKL